MAKRSISKTFNKKDTPGHIHEWILPNLPLEAPLSPYLKQKIIITIHLDPEKIGSLIAEGPKVTHRQKMSETGRREFDEPTNY